MPCPAVRAPGLHASIAASTGASDTRSRTHEPRGPARLAAVRVTRSGVSTRSADIVWADVAQRLQTTLSHTAYSAWFGSAQALELEEERLRVGVPNEFTRAWIMGHFSGLVQTAANDAADGLTVEFAVSGGDGTAATAATDGGDG